MLVVAGPGSGKTTVITHRIYHLIRQEHVLPDNILVITYTRAAAQEMKSRFLSLTGRTSTEVTFGTVHAVFYRILKAAYGLQSGQIIGERQQLQIMRELCRMQGIRLPYQDPFYLHMLSAVSRVKNELEAAENAAPDGCGRECFASVLQAYQRYLTENRYVDFDDLQLYCRDLLRKRADILSALRDKYRYILVDEFQDCNPIQYELIRMLAAPENHLFLVGDDDQSIYSFRGASPMLMQQFLKDYPDAGQVTLGTNYRSHPQIIKSAYRLIGHNRIRLAKKEAAAAGACREQGAAVVYRRFPDQRSEVMFIRKQIETAGSHGLSYRDMAVLARTNTQLFYFREALEAAGIPCVCRETVPNLYRHWVAEDILAYLHVAAGGRDAASFLRIMNRPNRFLARDMLPAEPVSFQAWRARYASQEWMQKRIAGLEEDLSVMGRMRPYAAVTYLLQAVGYAEWLKDYAQSRGLYEETLTDVTAELSECAKEYDSIRHWLAAIRRTVEATDERRPDAADARGVQLMTFHAAKGLEYPVVFLPDLCEGIVPYHRAVYPSETEEERRMLYVAVTRAKEKLFLMTSDEIRNHKKEPSMFLTELAGKDVL